MEVNIGQDDSQLCLLLERVESGEEVILARAGMPVAKLVAVKQDLGEQPLTKKRVLGQARGKITLTPGWDDPMTEEELAEWGA